MSFTLYPHQNTFVAEIREKIKLHKKVLAVAATGFGKSKVFITIAKGSIEKNRTVLIITEKTKIYNQIHKEIGDTVNIGDGIKEFYLEPNKIYVSMAQTLQRRPGLIDQLNKLGDKLLIIADEAHNGAMSNVLKQLKDAYLIGFTASPDFRRAKHLPEIYNEIVVGAQPQELVENGFLTPYHHFERQVVDLSKLKKSVNGDYSEKSQEDAFQKVEVFDGITEDLKKFKFNKCMIFCASIKHCKDVTEKLRVLNYDVSECHSKNPNSDHELFQFTHGSNTICVSVSSLTTGFDCPPVDLIILNRATISLPLFLQMIGRGARIFIGKNVFNVIDYGKNGSRHGFWNYEHPWEDMWNKPLKDKGAAPIKMCKGCGYMMPVNVNPCPECGTITIHIPTEKEIKQTELIEITAKYNGLRGRNISTLTPKELNDYVKMTNKKLFAQRIARAKGTQFLSEYAVFAKWKYGWQNHYIADTSLNYADIVLK